MQQQSQAALLHQGLFDLYVAILQLPLNKRKTKVPMVNMKVEDVQVFAQHVHGLANLAGIDFKITQAEDGTVNVRVEEFNPLEVLEGVKDEE